jgi:signal transduction histidine kinase
MAKQSITVELDDETVRYLAVLGTPVEVLAQLAYSAAEGARHLGHEQREQTDVSLRLERDKADVAIAKERTIVEGVADDVMRIARERADQVVQTARDDADGERGPRSTATEARSERGRADGRLADERSNADAVLEHERVELRRNPDEFLRSEREATDKDLSGERTHADTLIVDQREANAQMIHATIRAQELAVEAEAAKARAEESERELRAVAEFREMFIGILGHDLRNPLNTMVMASGLLIAHGDLTDEDARLVNRITNSGQRMARMIGQLVEFTRARLGGGFELNLAPSDLGNVCRDIAEELRISSSAEIRQTIEGDLGGTWDADRLAEAVSNIAGNALDHATPGTPVLIHAHDDGGAVVAEITNQGACIPADVLPVIFKAFHRGRVKVNANTDSGHLGMGLYIASEIVRAHGGTVGVRSSDGVTTFTLRLPRVSPPRPHG